MKTETKLLSAGAALFAALLVSAQPAPPLPRRDAAPTVVFPALPPPAPATARIRLRPAPDTAQWVYIFQTKLTNGPDCWRDAAVFPATNVPDCILVSNTPPGLNLGRLVITQLKGTTQ